MKGLQHAPATLCCWFTTTNTQDASTREYQEMTAREQQILEKLIHALQDNLEPALLSQGWLASRDRTPLTDPTAAQYPAASSSTIVTKLDVPGVALALQLSPPESKRSAAQQVETQLHLGADMEVHITATRQVTEELLKMVDWGKIRYSSD